MSSRIVSSASTTRLVVACAGLGAADPEEDVLDERRVVRPFPNWALECARCRQPVAGRPSCSSTGEFCGPASKIRPESLIPGTSAVASSRRRLRDSVAKPRPEHDRVRAVTTIGGAGHRRPESG